GQAAEAKALAIWSAIGGAGCIIAVWFFFGALQVRLKADPTDAARRTQLWAVLLLACMPLFWVTGLRPMSDMPGLALAIGAQALMLRSKIPVGALIAGMSAGMRSQVTDLAIPL